MDDLVSIITPTFNSETFISETISSVLNQSHTNWEFIIVDDASSDTTIPLIEKFQQKEPRILLYKNQENLGASFCRNQATKIAKGTYIAFLDSDDLWNPRKLEKQLNLMKTANNNVSFTSYLQINEAGESLKKRIKALPTLSYKKQLKNNYIGNLTGMYNAAELGKITAPKLRKRQDWAVWLEAIKRNKKPAIGLQEDLAYYRVRKDSISANKLGLIKYNYLFYKQYLEFSTLKSLRKLALFFMEYFFIRTKQIQKL